MIGEAGIENGFHSPFSLAQDVACWLAVAGPLDHS
jgi:hypothetical protein